MKGGICSALQGLFCCKLHCVPVSTTRISTVDEFIRTVREDSAGWPHAWFRGERILRETDFIELVKLSRGG